MNHLRLLNIILWIALATTGCDKRGSDTQAAAPAATAPSSKLSMAPKAEIKVLADGSLVLDGQPATLESIDQRFAELANAKGVVWYYREAGESEPPPVALKVVDLVMKHRLPISMSSKPDFSDTIDDQGVSRPRRTGGYDP